MRCTLLAIVFDTPAVGGMTLAHHHEHGKEGVKTLSQKDITEKLDEKKTTTAESLIPGCQAVQMQPWSPRQPKSNAPLNCVRQFEQFFGRTHLQKWIPNQPDLVEHMLEGVKLAGFGFWKSPRIAEISRNSSNAAPPRHSRGIWTPRHKSFRKKVRYFRNSRLRKL